MCIHLWIRVYTHSRARTRAGVVLLLNMILRASSLLSNQPSILVFFYNPSLLTFFPPPLRSLCSLRSLRSLPPLLSLNRSTTPPPHHSTTPSHSVTSSLVPHSLTLSIPLHYHVLHSHASFTPVLLPSLSLSLSLSLPPYLPLSSVPSLPVVTLQEQAAATHGRRPPLTAWLLMPLSKAAPPTLSCVPWSYYTSMSGCVSWGGSKCCRSTMRSY